jgi:DNA-directed RNA polymerase subunit F
MAIRKVVTNGGSAIGEAIGDLLEQQVHKAFKEIEANNHVYFLTRYGKTKAGKESKKLLLPDEYGNEYNMDGLVINEGGVPLMLIESKYIRYKKHNRDKASWICNAHSAVRRFFPSIRSSVAVLAGSWSGTSLAMLTSYGVSYFLIPFAEIAKILSEYNVDFEWEENDYDKAMNAWNVFSSLSDEQKRELGEKMISIVKDELVEYVESVLDDTVLRELRQIVIEMHTNKNEVFKYVFDTKEEAMKFLEDFDGEFDVSQFKSIFQHLSHE